MTGAGGPRTRGGEADAFRRNASSPGKSGIEVSSCNDRQGSAGDCQDSSVVSRTWGIRLRLAARLTRCSLQGAQGGSHVVIVATLNIQGATLMLLIHWIEVGDPAREQRERSRARLKARRDALALIRESSGCSMRWTRRGGAAIVCATQHAGSVRWRNA